MRTTRRSTGLDQCLETLPRSHQTSSGVHDPFDLSQQDPPGIEASANGDIDRLHALELLNAAEDASSNVECDSFGLDKRAPFISTAARFGRRLLMALVEGNFIRVLGRVMQNW
jgi:hypothetical protein